MLCFEFWVSYFISLCKCHAQKRKAGGNSYSDYRNYANSGFVCSEYYKDKGAYNRIIVTVFLTVFETDMVGFPERNVNKDLFCILLCGVSKENSMNIIPNFYTNYVVGYNIDL